MYDSVHLFKNMYFNLLNKNDHKCTVCHSMKVGLPWMFTSAIWKLHSIEYSSETKMTYRLTLTDKVLHPTSIERVNVQLAIAATHKTGNGVGYSFITCCFL